MSSINLTPTEIDSLRSDTPGTQYSKYLMNAGAALMPNRVALAMKNYLSIEMLNGGYRAASLMEESLYGVYDSIARLIGSNREEIALTDNATTAWRSAFYSFPFKKGDRILTSESEYAANYVAYLQVAQQSDINIDVVPSDHYGQIDIAALESMIKPSTRMISLTWMPTNGGLVNPAEEVGKIARKYGLFYLLDACQAVGQRVVNVESLGCDALSATGRKFLRGPRGTGFLYIRRGVLNNMHPPMIDHYSAPWVSKNSYKLRNDAGRFETWEHSYMLHAGLGAAVDLANELGVSRLQTRCIHLANRLRYGMKEISNANVLDLGSTH